MQTPNDIPNPEDKNQKAAAESIKERESSQQPEPQPKSATTNDLPSFGWSAYTERINGRFAMIGFIVVLLIEALSQDSFLHWAGLIQ